MEPSREVGAPPRLTTAAVVPGLAVALALDLIALAGWSGRLAQAVRLSPLLLVAIPWVTLLVLHWPAAVLGFVRQRAVARFGWGVLAGTLWRAASLAWNAFWTGRQALLGAGVADWLAGLIAVPFVEETFYRGYLGFGLQQRCGQLGAVVVQAVLFTLHPVHWSQGLLHCLSIFAFGLLAGALAVRTRSIWPAWGAHAMANVLPIVIAQAARG